MLKSELKIYLFSSCMNPILRRGIWDGSLACSSASASLMASSCARVDSLMSFWSASMSSTSCLKLFILLSISAIFDGNANAVRVCRIATNARVTIMPVSMATSLLSTLASANAPCSVKANGKADLERFARDVITNCDEMAAHSVPFCLLLPFAVIALMVKGLL